VIWSSSQNCYCVMCDAGVVCHYESCSNTKTQIRCSVNTNISYRTALAERQGPNLSLQSLHSVENKRSVVQPHFSLIALVCFFPSVVGYKHIAHEYFPQKTPVLALTVRSAEQRVSQCFLLKVSWREKKERDPAMNMRCVLCFCRVM